MEKNRKIVLICFLGISCLWLLSVLLWAWKTPGEQITYTDAKYYNFNFDWYDEEGNTFNMHEYKYQTSQVDREVTLYYDLPKNLVLGPDYALCFMSRGIDFRVYLEDQAGNKEEIYAFDQNGAGFAGKDIGLTVQFVPIRPRDLGKTLTFVNTPRSTNSFMIEMRLTKNHEYLYSVIRPRLTYFLESFFITFFGMATVLYTLFAAEKEKKEKTYYYAIGCTEIILGMILMIQSQLLQILTGKPEYFNVLKYALAVIVMYPLAVH
ncbi:MAG: hypothetical protein K5682_03005, partial [Lachnospiraceae bacterium]|nr:hypothetical protein [Lachnospiraceae bacterium]